MKRSIPTYIVAILAVIFFFFVLPIFMSDVIAFLAGNDPKEGQAIMRAWSIENIDLTSLLLCLQVFLLTFYWGSGTFLDGDRNEETGAGIYFIFLGVAWNTFLFVGMGLIRNYGEENLSIDELSFWRVIVALYASHRLAKYLKSKRDSSRQPTQ